MPKRFIVEQVANSYDSVNVPWDSTRDTRLRSVTLILTLPHLQNEELEVVNGWAI